MKSVSNSYHIFWRPKSEETGYTIAVVDSKSNSKYEAQNYVRTINEIFVYFYGCYLVKSSNYVLGSTISFTSLHSNYSE